MAYEVLCQYSIGIKMFFKRYRTNKVVYTKYKCLEMKQSRALYYDYQKFSGKIIRFFSVY